MQIARIITNTQSKYILNRKNVTQQGSYNLEVHIEQFLKDIDALEEIDIKTAPLENYKAYTLKNGYKIELGENIIDIIGEKYSTVNNKVVFLHTEDKNGGSAKFQLKQTEFKKQDSEEYNWFVSLYDHGIENMVFVTDINKNSKIVKFEIKLSKIFANFEQPRKIYDYKSIIDDGINIIVYGTPGCGKSTYVKDELLKKYKSDNIIRTTFFSEYSNSDFVGQILPTIKDDGAVSYEFVAGPFSIALEKAVSTPNEKVALVIEELNRGDASSIFGDIFQLLDRNNGKSEYPITNVHLQSYLENRHPEYKFDYIVIPSNFSIFSTMNTSDQNVYTLDTAFKRRWRLKKLKNIFTANHRYKDYYVPGMKITWEDFVNAINEHIIKLGDDSLSEDKQIGIYFIDDGCLEKEEFNITDFSKDKAELFAYKFFEYIWNDVAKIDKDEWFENKKTLDQLIDSYLGKAANGLGLEVFKDGIFKEKNK